MLEQAVSATPYLAGDEFSMADLYLAAHLGFGMRFGNIEPRPAFQAYATRMMSRPAAVRADALDDASDAEGELNPRWINKQRGRSSSRCA